MQQVLRNTKLLGVISVSGPDQSLSWDDALGRPGFNGWHALIPEASVAEVSAVLRTLDTCAILAGQDAAKAFLTSRRSKKSYETPLLRRTPAGLSYKSREWWVKGVI